MDAPLETRSLDLESSGPIFTRALLSALGRVPIWLLVWSSTFLLAVAVALPWYSWLNELVDHRYAPGQVSGYLDTIFRQDHKDTLGTLNAATAETASILAFMAMLFGVFFAGGWLQIVLERTRGQSLRRFLFGGARYFWRFLRVMFITLLVILFFGWLLYGSPFKELVLGSWLGVPKADWGTLETLDSEGTMFAVRATLDVLYALIFGLTLCWADYTRTRLALQGTNSAVWAGLQTFFTILRHPIMTLRPLVLLLLVEAAVLLLFALLLDYAESAFVAAEGAEAPTMARVWMIGLVSQVVLAWRIVIRGARYHATALVSQGIVRPISRPDPWRESIGGPGGPRYPLEEGDEYGVAL